MNIMTKRGNLDNVVTYEHICDTTADMNNIDPQYITLGSICIVINNEDSGMEVYMANSNKEWNSIAMGAGSSDGGSGASSLMNLLDVEVLNPTDGQTLTYDATAQKWINSGGGSTGGVMVVKNTFNEMDETILDHTWNEMFNSIANGVPVLVCSKLDDSTASTEIVSLEHPEENVFNVYIYTGDGSVNFTCDNPNGYPKLDLS